MWPHRRQPTRLPRPWDSQGKNSGVGCHFLFQCIKVKSESEIAQSCPILSNPMDCSLPGSSAHGIFQARVLEWDAIAFSNCDIKCQANYKDHPIYISECTYHVEILFFPPFCCWGNWVRENVILIGTIQDSSPGPSDVFPTKPHFLIYDHVAWGS